MTFNPKDYHPSWKQISRGIVKRAKNRCELCDAENYKPHWKTKSKVVLTVHHINGDKKDNDRLNLIALCQRCHLRLDLKHHVQKRKKNRNKNEDLKAPRQILLVLRKEKEKNFVNT